MTRTYSSFAETSLGGSLGSSNRSGAAIERGLVAGGIIEVVPGSVFSAVCGQGVDAWHAARDLDRMGWTLAYRALTKTDTALCRNYLLARSQETGMSQGWRKQSVSNLPRPTSKHSSI